VRRPRLSPAGAEELVNFDNFVPFGEADEALLADEALFHAQGKPAAPMPKAAPLPPIAGLGRVRTPVPDLASVLVNTKMPVSELGKTLNQLGKAAAQAGSEMQKVMDQAFKKALTGRS
jgi:hypothetical protein